MRYLVPLGFLLASTTCVAAADFGGPSYDGSLKDGPGITVHNWSGFYVGAHAGYGWADWSSSVAHPCPKCLPQQHQADAFAGSGDLGGDGWLGGFQVGAARQIGPWVLGVEADVSWPDMSGSHTFRMDYDTDWAVQSSIELMGTGRVKIGYSLGRVQVYGTGGVAWAIVDSDMQTVSITGPVVMSELSSSTSHVGWTVGAGMEWAMTDRLSVKADYLYIDIGEEDHDPKGLAYAGTPQQFNHHELMSEDLKIHTVRVGVNVKLGP